MIYLEVIIIISTLICVLLTSKRNIWAWPVGIISIISFFYIYLDQNFYFQTFLQVIFLIQSIYGWISWKKQKDRSEFVVKRHKLGQFSMEWGLTVLLGVILGDIMHHYTNSTLPLLDGISTTLAILATYYLAKGYVESWLIWVVVNAILFNMALAQGLYIIATLEVVLLLISINAYIEWRRSIKTDCA